MADVAAFFSGAYGRGLEGTDELYVVDAIKSIQREERNATLAQQQAPPQQQQAQRSRAVFNSMGEADAAGRLANISAGLDEMGMPVAPPRPIGASLEDLKRASQAHKELLEKLDRRAFMAKYGKSINKLMKARQCTRCQRAFTLADSIGAWQCRMHPGVFEDGRWTCCGRRAIAMDRLHVALKHNLEVGTVSGCTPVDHTYMYLSNVGVGDGLGVWRMPPELRKLLLYKPFSSLEPGHDAAWKFAVIWNARSSKEAGTSTLAPPRELDNTELEAAIRSGSALAVSKARYDVIGAKSRYSGYKSSDAEERRRSREQASRDLIVVTSPLPLWDQRWIGKHAFDQLEAERVKAR